MANYSSCDLCMADSSNLQERHVGHGGVMSVCGPCAKALGKEDRKYEASLENAPRDRGRNRGRQVDPRV